MISLETLRENRPAGGGGQLGGVLTQARRKKTLKPVPNEGGYLPSYGLKKEGVRGTPISNKKKSNVGSSPTARGVDWDGFRRGERTILLVETDEARVKERRVGNCNRVKRWEPFLTETVCEVAW